MVQTRYDAAGQVIGTVAYVTPVDLKGALTVSDFELRGLLKPNPADVSEYRYYTAGGRLAMTVSGTGDVVSYAYDGNGNVTERIAYATRLPAASIGAAQMPAPPQLNPSTTSASARSMTRWTARSSRWMPWAAWCASATTATAT